METTNNTILSYLDWALRGRPAIWRYAVGCIFLYLLLTLGRLLLAIPIMLVFGPYATSGISAPLVVNHLDFIVILLSVPLLTWLLHGRPGWSVALPSFNVGWINLLTGFVAALIVMITATVINFIFLGIKVEFVPRDLSVYLPFVITAFLTFLVQTSAEELVLRGYFMQALRRINANPVFVIVVSAAAFAYLHSINLSSFGWPWWGILAWFFDGCILGWIAYRSGSLWMSIGWHWATNFGQIALIAVANSRDAVQGVSIFMVDGFPPLEFILLLKIVLFSLAAIILNILIAKRQPSPFRADT